MIGDPCRMCGVEPCACAPRPTVDTVTRDLENELARALELWLNAVALELVRNGEGLAARRRATRILVGVIGKLTEAVTRDGLRSSSGSSSS